MLNFHFEPRTKILPHFKGSECEIAFSKIRFLLAKIDYNVEIFLTLYTETCAHYTVTCALHLENCVYYTEICVLDTDN